jgi:hypothetical protein
LKYLIIFDGKNYLSNLLLLNIIVEKILRQKLSNEIILLCLNFEIIDSLYFKKENVSNIINLKGLKSIYSSIKELNSDKSKKIIINISSSNYIKLYLFFIKRIKNKYNPGTKINTTFSELDFNFNITKQKSKYLVEYLSKTEIRKTNEYINWILTSSNNKKIDKLRFIYVLLDTNYLEYKRKEIQILSEYISSKNTLKIIFSFYNYNKTIVNNFLKSIDLNIKSKILTNKFLTSDKNFKVNLLSNSKIFITDDELYHFFSTEKNIEAILLKKEDNNKINQKLLEDNLSYLN